LDSFSGNAMYRFHLEKLVLAFNLKAFLRET
jgi:hypothetical protein